MNAAGRLVHQSVISRHLVFTHLLSKQQIMVLMLSLAVLMSAISMIYVTHLSRVLQASYQRDLNEQDQLYLQRGQLLLERSTWMVQTRIQKLAEKKLGMVIPDHKSVVIIHE